MLRHVDHAPVKIGIGQPRRCHQEMVPQTCLGFRAGCHPDVSPRLWNDQVRMISSSSTCSRMSSGKGANGAAMRTIRMAASRSEEHTSELQSRPHLVCRLLLEKK